MRSKWRRKFSDTVSAFPRMLGTRLHLRLYEFLRENVKGSVPQQNLLEAAHGVLLGELAHISNVIEIDSKLVIEFIYEGLASLVTAFSFTPSLTSLKLGAERRTFESFYLEPDIANRLAKGLESTPLLTHLKLSNFAFDEDNGVFLSNCLRSTTQLTKLDLQYRSIDAIAVQHLAEGLKHTPHITSLILEASNGFDVCPGRMFVGSAIGEAGVGHIVDALQHTPSLTLLDLCGGDIRDAGVELLAAGLGRVSRLTTLHVDGSNLTAPGAGALFRALHHVPLLTSLDVGNHVNVIHDDTADDSGFGDEGATSLGAALHFLPLLAALRVARSGIGDSGALALARELPVVPNLTALSMEGNPLGAGLEALLKAATRLRCLDLRGSELSRAAQTALHGGLQHLPALASLDLSEVQLGTTGLRTLEQGLKGSSALTRLCLHEADVSPNRPTGVLTLGRILKLAPTLRTLNLTYLGIGADGVRRVAAGLRAVTGLTELWMAGNDMDEAGAEDLADVLGHLPALVRLDVSGNGLKNGGATLLADALRGATSLTVLDASSNAIGLAGLRLLAAALRRAPPLPSVEFLRCSLPPHPTHASPAPRGCCGPLASLPARRRACDPTLKHGRLALRSPGPLHPLAARQPLIAAPHRSF